MLSRSVYEAIELLSLLCFSFFPRPAEGWSGGGACFFVFVVVFCGFGYVYSLRLWFLGGFVLDSRGERDPRGAPFERAVLCCFCGVGRWLDMSGGAFVSSHVSSVTLRCAFNSFIDAMLTVVFDFSN